MTTWYKKQSHAHADVVHLPAQRIGSILVEEGRMTNDGVEQVLQRQHEKGASFGQTACELGLVSNVDIDFALARQFTTPVASGNETPADPLRIVCDPSAPTGMHLRMLRADLVTRWFSRGNRVLHVVGMQREIGCSLLIASLAVLLGQIGKRVVVVDANLRMPTQHQLLRATNRIGLGHVLAERVEVGAVLQATEFSDVTLLPAGMSVPNPEELLARPAFAALIEDLSAYYEVILCDSAAADSPSVFALNAVLPGTLLVLRKHEARLKQVEKFIQRLNSTVIGAVVSEIN